MQDGVRLSEQEALFLGVAEQLMRPFLQISRLAEQADGSSWPAVQAIAEASLQLAESYALGLRVRGHVVSLRPEPITVSALLYDTAEALLPLARQYGVALTLDTGPRVQPIVADRRILQAALVSLGQVFVRAQAEADEPAPVRLQAYRSRHGVVAGLYGAHEGLGADSLRRAHALHGAARQPLPSFVSDPAAGVFVAEHLLHTMATKLHVARYRNLTGLAATLTPSQQLQFV